MTATESLKINGLAKKNPYLVFNPRPSNSDPDPKHCFLKFLFQNCKRSSFLEDMLESHGVGSG